MSKRKSSDGTAGETAALYHFRLINWTMIRSQPEARIIKALGKGKYIVVFKNGGIADYIGYNDYGQYRACEVKEATGNSMPASRLDINQRFWMAAQRKGSAFVGIYWTDAGEFELFRFKEKGSYKKGKGLKV